jgi:hypothetical protein
MESKFAVGDQVCFIAVVDRGRKRVVRPMAGETDDLLPFEEKEGMVLKNVGATVVGRMLLHGRIAYELEAWDGQELGGFTFLEDDVFKVPEWMTPPG